MQVFAASLKAKAMEIARRRVPCGKSRPRIERDLKEPQSCKFAKMPYFFCTVFSVGKW